MNEGGTLIVNPNLSWLGGALLLGALKFPVTVRFRFGEVMV